MRRIHARTHLHPDTMEVLSKRSGYWNKETRNEVKHLNTTSGFCLKSGERRKTNKFSVAKLNREFNEVVEIDAKYWGNIMALHGVDSTTGYSELSDIRNRKLDTILPTLEKMWSYATERRSRSKVSKNLTRVASTYG